MHDSKPPEIILRLRAIAERDNLPPDNPLSNAATRFEEALHGFFAVTPTVPPRELAKAWHGAMQALLDYQPGETHE
jgi:hypothetical protein